MKYKSKWTREDYENALSLREQGLSFTKISAQTGIPAGTVQHWASGAKPWSAWTEEEFKQHAENFSQIRIGKKPVDGELVETPPRRLTGRGRLKARKIMKDEPKICYFCKGTGEPYKWVVHHIDEMESNNARENLAWAHSFCNKSHHARNRVWTQKSREKMRQLAKDGVIGVKRWRK